MATVKQVTIDELAEAVAQGAQLIDVRTPMEFAGGHVPGAVNQPLGKVDPSTLDPARPVWLVCRSGARSNRAAHALAAQGFDARNVSGGTMAWKAAGNPLDGERSGPSLILPLGLSLTLGLAPFVPEPHIVGKLRWVLGGAEGMASADWFDLVMHGAPWLWLAMVLVQRARLARRG